MKTRNIASLAALAATLFFVGAARAGIVEDLANATILEDFLFNDAAGISYDAAANSANAGNLLSTDADLAGVVTNGLGALNASVKSNVDLGTTLVDTPINVTSGRVLGVMEMTWDFQSPLDTAENEELRISLIHTGTSTVTAEWEIQREDDDTLTIIGTAVNGTGIAAQTLNGGSLTQSTKFVAVVDADLDSDTYLVHFSNNGGASFTTIGPGTIDPVRIVDKMRMVLNNDLSGDNVLVDRIYLATIPEPASCGLAGLAAVSLLAWRRRSR
jgi:hypothetical protein